MLLPGFVLCVVRLALTSVNKGFDCCFTHPFLHLKGVDAIQRTCALYFMDPILIIMNMHLFLADSSFEFLQLIWSINVRPGADAIKEFTPSLGIPYLGV